MNSNSDLRTNLWAAVGVAAIIAIAFAPIWFGGQSFYHLDTYFEHVPFWQFASETVARGDWPWWTPNIRAGYPLHANGEASLLYPIALPLGLVLPAHRAVDLFTLFHLFALGVFTWRYLRELDVPPWLAFTGAIAFALSGRMVASMIWPNAVAASCFLPLLLLGIERTRKDPHRGLTIVAAAVALGLLAGRPQRFVPVLLFAAAYTAMLAARAWRREGGGEAGRLLGWVGGGALLGAAFAAPQVLPTLQLVGDSIWADGLTREVFESNSLKGRPFAKFLAPSGPPTWAEARLYPGWFVYVGLAIGGVRLVWKRLRIGTHAAFMLGSAAVCFWLAFAGPFAYEICQTFPILESLRSPVRFLFPASFAVAMFAVLAIRDAIGARTLPASATRIAAGLACAELAIVSWFTAPTGPSSLYDVRPTVLEAFSNDARDPTGFSYRTYASGHWVAPHLVTELDEDALAERFAALPLTRDLAMRYGRYSSTGYGEPRLAWKDAVHRRLVRNEMNQLGVRRLFMSHRLKSGGYTFDREHGVSFVYSNPTPLPRSLCVSILVSAADAQQAIAHAADSGFDPNFTAVVERAVADRIGGPCAVRATHQSPTRVALEVDADRSTWLLLFDTWAPGWRARVNGVRVDIERANGMFRLIAIPSGSSEIEFEYRPPGFALGLGLSASAISVWLLMWRRRGRGDAMLRPRDTARG